MDPPPTATNSGSLARQEKRRKDYLVGIFLLLSVVLLWTASNFLTNTVLTRGYDKPFAVTYANTSSFALYLIPFALAGSSSRRRNRKRASNSIDSTPSSPKWWEKLGFTLPPTSIDLDKGSYFQLPTDSETPFQQDQQQQQPNLNRRPVSPTDIRSEIAGGRQSTNSLVVPSNGLIEGQEDGSNQFGSLTRSTARPRSRNQLHSHVRACSPISHRPSSIDGRRPRSIVLTRRDSVNSLLVQPLPIGRTSTAISNRESELQNLPPLTLRETAALAATFTLVWFAANWSLNAGLGLTSVASGTTLSSASGFFTLALGSLFGVEAFSIGKLGAVTMSFLGVVLVTWADSDNSASDLGTLAAPINAPLGDALALLSAFFYAVYVTLLKLRIGSEDRVSMPLFFGFVGAFNILAMWPVGLVLSLTSIEPFEWPSDTLTWIGILVNMSITFVSDFAYLLAMLKSSPLLATVGLSLTIPLAVAGDLIRGSHSGGAQADLGSVIVLLSFVAIALADESSLSIPTDANNEGFNPTSEAIESSSAFTFGYSSSAESNDGEAGERVESENAPSRPNDYNSINQPSKRSLSVSSSSSMR